MTRLVDPEFERALASIDIETYLDSEGIDYRNSYGTRGRQLNLRECPACHEGGFKTYINAETGLGNCFHGACGKKFNRFWLFKAVSGLGGEDFDAYVKATAENQGWLPRKAAPTLAPVAGLQLPTKCYPLPIDGRNLLYLEERGVPADVAAHFGLQFCQKGWWKYELTSGETKWVSYDDRVIIPILDLAGNMVSFQGRDVTGEKEPKYLFPAGFAVAGSHIYNGHNFEDGITRHMVMGEGVFDAIAIHMALLESGKGDTLACASFGMHLSSGPGGQIEKFSSLKVRGLKTVTIMWDGERKAKIAAVKAALQLRGIGLATRVAFLPEGKDPNEVPASVVNKAIDKAQVISSASATRLLTMLSLSHC